MLEPLKKKNLYAQAAEAAYAAMLEHIRKPAFYKDYGVPDTFDGRFELLVLHAFLVIERAGSEGQEFAQALFDVLFADMDQTLREIGIGDMGVPKHMRRMMKAFNGRMHAYHAGPLGTALGRNLYGTLPQGFIPVEKMAAYVLECREALKSAEPAAGRIAFKEP